MSSLQNRSIAYLGLGIMGAAMAANLSRAGAQVKGWNRTAGKETAESARQAGVEIAPTIKEAVENADVIFTCVGDENDVLEIVQKQIVQHAKHGSTVIDTTTIGPAAARKAAEILQSHQVHFLDAPVTGGDVGAREATLTILVGGEEEVFQACQPVFASIGKRIFYCGPSGQGQAMKLCNQILCAVNMLAVSEAMSLADSMGISQELLIESLSAGAGGSWALSTLGPRIAAGDFAPGFTLRHMLKDLRLVDGNREDLSLPATKLAKEMFDQAAALKTGQPSGDTQGTQSMFRVYAESRRG